MLYSKAGLRIIGEFEPDTISKTLGLSPSFTYHKGQKDRIGNLYEFDIWGLNSPLQKTVPLEEHLQWLVENCKDKYEIFRKIKEKNKIDIFCSITSSGESGISINSKSLSILQELQIDLEISLITLSEDK